MLHHHCRYKLVVASSINDMIAPIRQKYQDYLKDPQYLINVLDHGKEQVLEVTEKTLIEVRYHLGIRYNMEMIRKTVNVNA